MNCENKEKYDNLMTALTYILSFLIDTNGNNGSLDYIVKNNMKFNFMF